MPRTNRPGPARQVALALGFAALLATPSRLPAPLPPPTHYVLINSTSAAVTCSAGTHEAGWGAAFSLSAGAQWNSRDYNRADHVHLHCRPPVRQADYTLRKGTRYVIGPDAAGLIEVRQVSA
jgi:hypothetical protein